MLRETTAQVSLSYTSCRHLPVTIHCSGPTGASQGVSHGDSLHSNRIKALNANSSLKNMHLIISLLCLKLINGLSQWKWSCSVVSNSATPWTVARQAPPSMGFSRWDYWIGLPFPSPGDLPDPRIEPKSPALQAYSLLSEPPRNPISVVGTKYNILSVGHMDLPLQPLLGPHEPLFCQQEKHLPTPGPVYLGTFPTILPAKPLLIVCCCYCC